MKKTDRNGFWGSVVFGRKHHWFTQAGGVHALQRSSCGLLTEPRSILVPKEMNEGNTTICRLCLRIVK